MVTAGPSSLLYKLMEAIAFNHIVRVAAGGERTSLRFSVYYRGKEEEEEDRYPLLLLLLL